MDGLAYFCGMSRGVWYMALAVLFFSVMNLGVKFLDHLPVMEVVCFRAAISLVLAYGSLWYAGHKPWGPRMDLLLLRGLLGFVAMSTFFVTLQEMPLASAVTIQYLSPFFVAVLSIFLLGEPMAPLQWVWFILAMTGVVLIKGFSTEVTLWYLALGIFSALFSGLAYSTVRKLKDYHHPLVVTFYFHLVSLLLSIVPATLQFQMPVGIDWWVILATGVFAQLGQLFMTLSLHLEKANIVASMKYVGILYGLVYGYFFFDETYNWGSLGGILLILFAVGMNVFWPSGVRGVRR
jgi:drug/metabolite transporter (DMT)-like permease